jgi:protein required for attachment to host cells
MMSVTWILVANASQARLFENLGPKKGLRLMKAMEHPESREKAANLVSDRVGNFQGSGSYAQPTDPKHHEMDRFALEIAHELESGRATNAFARLVLVVSAPFIGRVRQHLNEHLRGKVSDSIEKDYTKLPEKDLAGQLATVVNL